MYSGPKLLFVDNPQDKIEEEIRDQRNKAKVVKQVIDFDFLDDMEKIDIKDNFSKYMDKETYAKANLSLCDINSEESLKKFNRILDGYGEISFTSYNEKGEMISDGSIGRHIKIHLFNEDDDHYMGLHFAVLCMEVGEESWFVMNDAYTSPLFMAQGLKNLESKVEMQVSNKIYKIKLHQVKERLRKTETTISEDGKLPEINIDEYEMNLQKEIQGVEERKNQIKNTSFYEKKYVEAYDRYKRLGSQISNLINRFGKYLDKTNPFLAQLQEIGILVGQNICACASKTKQWSKLDEAAKTLLEADPANMKGAYFEARALYQLAYFDKAEQKILSFQEKFKETQDIKAEFEVYMERINLRKKNSVNKEKEIYKNVLENMKKEEKKEKIQKLNQEQIEAHLRLEKEQIVHKILDKKGFEFCENDYDLLEKLDGDDQEKEQHSQNINEDQQ